MNLNIQKTNVICFVYETNSIHFSYFIGDFLILWTNSVQDLGVMLHSKLYLHQHINYITQSLGWISSL
jgi:hypothetical protein